MKINQNGFGTIGVVLAVFVMALIGGIGWFLLDAKQTDTTHTNTSTSSPTTQNSKSVNVGSYLTLEDFKVRVPLDDKTDGLKLGTVSTSSYNEADKSIPVLAPELDATWKCETDGGVKGTIGTISITAQEKRSGPYEPLATKKIGNYTYDFEPSGPSCTDSPAHQQLIDAFKNQFQKIEAY